MNATRHTTVLLICLAAGMPSAVRADDPDANTRRRWLRDANETLPRPAAIDGADKPGVKPFPYTLKLSADPPRTSLQQGPRTCTLTLTSQAIDPTREIPAALRLTRADGNSWVDLAAVMKLSGKGDAGKAEQTTPRSQGTIELPTLWFPPDRPAFVRIRWQGRSDVWGIRADDDKLTLIPLRAPNAKVLGRAIPDCRTLRLTDSGRNEHYQLTPFALWREDGPKLRWIRPVTLLGRPADGTLGKDFGVFRIEQPLPIKDGRDPVESSKTARVVEHSLLFRRGDGQAIVHCPAAVDVRNPFPDVHAAAIREINASPNAPVMRRYVRALAELGDKKAARLLVEIMLKSPDRPTSAMAVAALERLYENRKLWAKHYADGCPEPPAGLKKRVATVLARKKEALRWWRKVGRPRKHLLNAEETRPAPAGTGKALKKQLKRVDAKKQRLGL
ncbi:MAG: hypothetical protein ACLFTN_02815 [Phycisphaerae bacterium]